MSRIGLGGLLRSIGHGARQVNRGTVVRLPSFVQHPERPASPGVIALPRHGLPGRTAEKRPGVVVTWGSFWGGSPMAAPWRLY